MNNLERDNIRLNNWSLVLENEKSKLEESCRISKQNLTKDELLLAKAEVEMAVTCADLNKKIINKQQEVLLLRGALTDKEHELREANVKISGLGHEVFNLKEKYEKPRNIQYKWKVKTEEVKKGLGDKKEKEEEEEEEIGGSVDGVQGSLSSNSKFHVFYRNGDAKNAVGSRTDSVCFVDSIYEEKSSRGCRAGSSDGKDRGCN